MSDNNAEFIMKAIDDTQSTIRFTDTKAAAVIGFWTLIITTSIRMGEHIQNALIDISHWLEASLITALVIGMFVLVTKSIWLSYMSLVPSSNPNKHVDTDGIEPKELFYLNGFNKPSPLKNKYLYRDHEDLELYMNTNEYLAELKGLSYEEYLFELIYEQQKVSFIRSLKIARVNRAITYIFIFLVILLILLVYFIGKLILSL